MSVADELQKLKALLDDGILTAEEFEAQKKKLLDPGESTSTPIDTNIATPSPIAVEATIVTPRKKKDHGCLVAILIIIAIPVVIFLSLLIWATVESSSQGSYSSSQTTSEVFDASIPPEEVNSLLDFDARTWEDFKKLYVAHNDLMKATGNFSDGNMTASSFNEYCAKAKDYFSAISTNFYYGVSEDEKTYLSNFRIIASADQRAVEQIQKYIDSNNAADLSSANKELQRAKDAFVLIAQNRALLLARAGLSKDEINQKIDADMSDLDGTT